MTLRPTETVLSAIAGGKLDQAAVLEATGLKRTQVHMAVQKLRIRELITIVTPGHYAITDAGRQWAESGKPIVSGQGAKKLRPTSGLRQRAWWLMVREGTFTLDSLLFTAATGAERNAEDNLGRYLKALESTGFIKRLTPRGGSCDDPPVWSINRERAGRKAPVYRRQHQLVVCGKTGKTYPLGDCHG